MRNDKHKTDAVVTNIWFNLFSSDSIRNLKKNQVYQEKNKEIKF